jgi:hypothetical protein
MAIVAAATSSSGATVEQLVDVVHPMLYSLCEGRLHLRHALHVAQRGQLGALLVQERHRVLLGPLVGGAVGVVLGELH